MVQFDQDNLITIALVSLVVSIIVVILYAHSTKECSRRSRGWDSFVDTITGKVNSNAGFTAGCNTSAGNCNAGFTPERCPSNQDCLLSGSSR